ncbi:hypothetical protein IG631_09741 [Alternaria alternata]|nr:hypothetical protein IG631_09741 [Alternaria alternata]
MASSPSWFTASSLVIRHSPSTSHKPNCTATSAPLSSPPKPGLSWHAARRHSPKIFRLYRFYDKRSSCPCSGNAMARLLEGTSLHNIDANE